MFGTLKDLTIEFFMYGYSKFFCERFVIEEALYLNRIEVSVASVYLE